MSDIKIEQVGKRVRLTCTEYEPVYSVLFDKVPKRKLPLNKGFTCDIHHLSTVQSIYDKLVKTNSLASITPQDRRSQNKYRRSVSEGEDSATSGDEQAAAPSAKPSFFSEDDTEPEKQPASPPKEATSESEPEPEPEPVKVSPVSSKQSSKHRDRSVSPSSSERRRQRRKEKEREREREREREKEREREERARRKEKEREREERARRKEKERRRRSKYDSTSSDSSSSDEVHRFPKYKGNKRKDYNLSDSSSQTDSSDDFPEPTTPRKVDKEKEFKRRLLELVKLLK